MSLADIMLSEKELETEDYVLCGSSDMKFKNRLKINRWNKVEQC